ncbi:hypothetical protein BCV72DRAFT_99293 [Rhizopus microsporus var. microsporus]|nr:hypothetical protein BCV72DRAFT_99293 [Rhizopus microsporus var. microsporus]
MSKLITSVPLRTIQPFSLTTTVLQLNQSLFANDVSNEMHVPKQLGQLELLLERAARLEQTRSSIPEEIKYKISLIHSDLQQYQSLIKRYQHKFAKAAEYVLNEPVFGEQEVINLCQLNQLYVTAARLYQDVNLEYHDYIAYQLALIYQCIHQQPDFASFKPRIEDRFDQFVHRQKKMRLNSDQIEWLKSFCLDILRHIQDIF